MSLRLYLLYCYLTMQSLCNVYKNWTFTFKVVKVVKVLDSQSKVLDSNLLGGFKIKVILAFHPTD